MVDRKDPSAPAADILVVDDTPENLHLLTWMLKKQGYKARPVRSGAQALQAASRVPPDLILLDVMMPEMDGYEVCRALKADPALADIPVLFISGLTSTSDRVKGLGAGAVDFVSKPLQFEEVAARIRTHLELQARRRELRESYERLRRLEETRDRLTHMIVHDMRAPLQGVIGSLDTIEADSLSKGDRRMLERARRSAHSLTEQIDRILDVCRMASGRLDLHVAECDVTAAARQTLQGREPHPGGLQTSVEGESCPVRADRTLLYRVLQNLVDNAARFTPSGGAIRVTVEQGPEEVTVRVSDTGSGIAPEDQERIFDKFYQPSGDDGRGLGLTFCRLAVEAHGGAIGVESQPGEGSTFWFTLPREPRQPPPAQ